MKQFDVLNATTKELIAFYNSKAEKPVTKFTNRQTAERRCLELLRSKPSAASNTSSHGLAQDRVVLKISKPSKGTISEGVTASWNDPEVRAARCRRDAVQVDILGPDGKATERERFKSVTAAFKELQIDETLSRIIRFRMKLKAKGISMGDYGCNWKIIPAFTEW